jgi:hypothetical protein
MNRKPLSPLAKLKRRPLAPCSDKQRGDAAEYLIAGMMILAGMPTAVMPNNWPGFDLMAVPPYGGNSQKISVKGRRDPIYVAEPGDWDWLGFVWIPIGGLPRYWLIPKKKAMPEPRVYGDWRLTLDRLNQKFHRFENNLNCSRTVAIDVSRVGTVRSTNRDPSSNSEDRLVGPLHDQPRRDFAAEPKTVANCRQST